MNLRSNYEPGTSRWATRRAQWLALGAVVTRVPAVTDLDADPCEVIATGDWVRIDADQGLVEVSKK